MKTILRICVSVSFLGCVPAFSQAETLPTIPKPHDIHAGFTGEDMSGPTKTSAGIFDSAEALVSSMEHATYLGRDIDIQDPRWLGKTNEYFNQHWLIVTKNKEGMSVDLWKAEGSSNRIFCRVIFFDEKSHEKTSSHCYYYVLPNKKGEPGGADQPATAPESKPEGKEKPQPESKIAPR